MYLNGEKVEDGVLSQVVTQFIKRSLTITYDVSSTVKKGRNDLVLWLGGGLYTKSVPGVVNGSLVKAQMKKLSVVTAMENKK